MPAETRNVFIDTQVFDQNQLPEEPDYLDGAPGGSPVEY